MTVVELKLQYCPVSIVEEKHKVAENSSSQVWKPRTAVLVIIIITLMVLS